MNIWIVTIGSSDVQLDSDNKCREKGRTEKQGSDKIWKYWYEEVQEDCYDIAFEPKQSYKDRNESYRIEPRVLGMVYEASSPEVQKEIFSYLTFPLLDNFVGTLKNPPSDAIAFGDTQSIIAVFLTDQSEFFSSNVKRRNQKCPYWQDTCTLKPILKQYFQDKDKFPNANCVWIPLSPAGKNGLDDWNYVLDLVRNKLREKLDGEEIEVHATDKVYVSHQAGTPAISSAVQFVSLAQFRTNVEFLVSNEYNQQTDKILSPTYLGAIQQQEAKALLARHDYSGVRDILGLTGTTPNNDKEKRLKYLLDAGEQWNFAEFQKFKNILVKRNLLSVSVFPWYQSGFESLYLAWIRLEQGSTVDALFHSFRAAEGSVIKWAEKHYSSYLVKDPKYGLQVKLSVCQKLPNYFNALSEPNQIKFQRWGQIGLYGDPIYELLKQARPDWKDYPDIRIVWESAKKERNNCFHQIEGLQESEVFEAWETKTKEEWKQRILGCLNFIAKEDLPQEFKSLEDASLMFQVHEELEKAIANYELPPNSNQ